MEQVTMIPRVIHYCWFGGNPLPEEAKRCIESWKKICPDYEIIEWNESNYNVNACSYTREAYQAKKWAFVSDYARFDILHRYGGIYLDTDVELIKPIEDILQQGAYMGIEQRDNGEDAVAAPGLGMAAPAGHPFYAEIIDAYKKLHFLNADGTLNRTTIVKYTSDLLREHGLQKTDDIQIVSGIRIYPWDYFCPMQFQTGALIITENTRSIHHYSATWFTKEEQAELRLTIWASQKLGPGIGKAVGRIYSFPYRVSQKVKQLGFWGAVRFALRKLKPEQYE